MAAELSSEMSFLTMACDIVTIRVGKPESSKDFPVYRDLLNAVSAYFRGAFAGDFKEATEGVLTLTDVSEQTFRVFLQWAHAQMFSSGSGAFIPDPSILSPLPAAMKRNLEKLSLIKRISPKTAFDEQDYQTRLMTESQRYTLYYLDEAWVRNYRCSLVAYLNLYIFADKYSVHQLRDDIMTAMLGQAHEWMWFPEPDGHLVPLACGNLPESAKFLRLLALCAANCWILDQKGDCREKLSSLRAWNPDFAFEVAVASAESVKFENSRGDERPMGFLGKDSHNSCFLHEHLEHDKDACRKRISNKAHVFAILIEACAKDGISMASEHIDP